MENQYNKAPAVRRGLCCSHGSPPVGGSLKYFPPSGIHRPERIRLLPVYRPLQPLGRGQGLSMRQCAVGEDHGVQGVAGGEARLFPEPLRPGGGGQIPRLRHCQRRRDCRVRHAADLGGPDSGGGDVKHIQMIASGNVTSQRYPDALGQHRPHRGSAGAEVQVGIRAVHHGDTGIFHGLPLPLIRPDTVGHEGAVIPKAVFGIGLPILLTVRVQLPDPLYFRPVFREVGLYRQASLRRQPS